MRKPDPSVKRRPQRSPGSFRIEVCCQIHVERIIAFKRLLGKSCVAQWCMRCWLFFAHVWRIRGGCFSFSHPWLLFLFFHTVCRVCVTSLVVPVDTQPLWEVNAWWPCWCTTNTFPGRTHQSGAVFRIVASATQVFWILQD